MEECEKELALDILGHELEKYVSKATETVSITTRLLSIRQEVVSCCVELSQVEFGLLCVCLPVTDASSVLRFNTVVKCVADHRGKATIESSANSWTFCTL